jgi:hypothetical protein
MPRAGGRGCRAQGPGASMPLAGQASAVLAVYGQRDVAGPNPRGRLRPGPIWRCAACRRAAAPRVVYARSMRGLRDGQLAPPESPSGTDGCGCVPVTGPGRESGWCRARRTAAGHRSRPCAAGNLFFRSARRLRRFPGRAAPPFETCRLGRQTSTPGQTCCEGVGLCRQQSPAPAATAARRCTIRWKKAHRRDGPGSAAPTRAAQPGTRGHASRGAKRNSGTTGISPSP